MADKIEYTDYRNSILNQVTSIVDDYLEDADIGGEKGDKGEKGDPGEPGLTGPPGERGEKGDPGEPGPRGPMGPVGEQGLRGLQGIQGDTGPRGATGAKGDKGDKGDTGVAGSPNLFNLSELDAYAGTNVSVDYNSGYLIYDNAAFVVAGFIYITNPGEYVVKIGTVMSDSYAVRVRIAGNDSNTNVIADLGVFTSGTEATFNITVSDINANGGKFRVALQVAGTTRISGQLRKITVSSGSSSPVWALSSRDEYLFNRDAEKRLGEPNSQGNLINNSQSVGFSKVALWNASQFKENDLLAYRLTLGTADFGYVQLNDMEKNFVGGKTYVFSIDTRTTTLSQLNYIWIIRTNGDGGANYSIHPAGRHETGNILSVTTDGKWNRTWVKFVPPTDMVGVIRVGVNNQIISNPKVGTIDFRLPNVNDQNRIDWFPSNNIEDAKILEHSRKLANTNPQDTYATGQLLAGFGNIPSSTAYSEYQPLSILFGSIGGGITYNQSTGELTLAEGYWMIDASAALNTTLGNFTLLLQINGNDTKWSVSGGGYSANLSGVYYSSGSEKFRFQASQSSGADNRLAATNRSVLTLKRIN